VPGARAVGRGRDRGLHDFAGLPHRLEEVARAAAWCSSTTARPRTRTPPPARSSPTPTSFWIAGGRPKPGGFASLRPLAGGVRRAYLIGEAAAEIERDLGDLVPVERSGALEAAVAAATRDARASGLPEAAVLLAPACASYDQFANFEARGDAFRALARAAATAGDAARDHDARPHGPLAARNLVVDDRPHAAGVAGAARRHRRRARLRRQPGRGGRKYGDGTHFIVRHIVFLAPSAAALLLCSLMRPLGVLRLAKGMCVVFGAMLLLTFLVGIDINGARRWLGAGALRLQPSEFLKPALAVLVAWLLSRQPGMAGLPRTLAVVLPVLALLAVQPDVGMAAVVAGVYGAQLFVAGIAWFWVIGLAGAGALGLWGAYLYLPHFTTRVNDFLHADTLGYQVEQALRAVAAGGLFGRGPGEGVTKFHLPDAHADFIFAATAEEFGIVACLLLVGLFAFIVARSLWRVGETGDRFVQLAAAGSWSSSRSRPRQHGREPEPDADQGHDPAVHQLRRLVVRGARDRHGHAPGAHPPRRPAGGPAVTAPVLVAAGGTGGHMFPALALCRELQRRGREVAVLTTPGARATSAPGLERHVVPAGSPAAGSVAQRLRAAASLAGGLSRASPSSASSGPSRPRPSAATPRSRRPWRPGSRACRCWSTSRTPSSAGRTAGRPLRRVVALSFADTAAVPRLLAVPAGSSPATPSGPTSRPGPLPPTRRRALAGSSASW
jgi:cell division protein FtsW